MPFGEIYLNSPVVPKAARDITARAAGGQLVDIEGIGFARMFCRELCVQTPQSRLGADVPSDALEPAAATDVPGKFD